MRSQFLSFLCLAALIGCTRHAAVESQPQLRLERDTLWALGEDGSRSELPRRLAIDPKLGDEARLTVAHGETVASLHRAWSLLRRAQVRCRWSLEIDTLKREPLFPEEAENPDLRCDMLAPKERFTVDILPERDAFVLRPLDGAKPRREGTLVFGSLERLEECGLRLAYGAFAPDSLPRLLEACAASRDLLPLVSGKGAQARLLDELGESPWSVRVLVDGRGKADSILPKLWEIQERDRRFREGLGGVCLQEAALNRIGWELSQGLLPDSGAALARLDQAVRVRRLFHGEDHEPVDPYSGQCGDCIPEAWGDEKGMPPLVPPQDRGELSEELMSPKLRDLQVEGHGRTPESILKTIQTNMGRIRFRWDRALRRGMEQKRGASSYAQWFKVRFVLLPSGQLEDISLVPPGSGDQDLDKEIREILRSWRFDSLAVDTVRVDWTLRQEQVRKGEVR